MTISALPASRFSSAQDSPGALPTPHAGVTHPPELAAEARPLRAWLSQVEAKLFREFAAVGGEELYRGARVRVHLLARPSRLAAPGLATLRCGPDRTGYMAELHMLALSRHPEGSRTGLGEPMDERYVRKTLMHELSTIILDRLTRKKAKGWRFFSAPRWFVQGFEESLALRLTDDHTRSVSTRLALRPVLADPKRIGFDFGISVKDAYRDGAALLIFMHEVYGRERLHKLLLSPEERFRSAMKTTLGTDLAGFAKAWRRWRKVKLAALKSSLSDGPKPDGPKPDVAKSDNAKSDNAKSDNAKSDNAKADNAKADNAKADSPKPKPGKRESETGTDTPKSP